jgi:hypothetical protein
MTNERRVASLTAEPIGLARVYNKPGTFRTRAQAELEYSKAS